MAQHHELGKLGEDFAANFLMTKGYNIIFRNWRCRHLEVDIVAMDANTLVFVEVKTRHNAMTPSDLISYRKMQFLRNAAEAYIKHFGYQGDARFDVIILTKTPLGFRVEHIQEAFR
ncbi:MAG: YraN family protein [Marinilabiliaceae bacterium]|nr:YraN family protein [Bacteroidales bacterium]MDD5816637.1 YraN family protein [Bacteroidales bacterium]MDY4520293.1 YraN family protein [Bacteroidales bacterium]